MEDDLDDCKSCRAFPNDVIIHYHYLSLVGWYSTYVIKQSCELCHVPFPSTFDVCGGHVDLKLCLIALMRIEA